MPGLSLGPSLSLSLECSVCLRNRKDSDDNDLAEALLCGLADAYSLCPCCKREVSKALRSNKAYRRRVRVYYFEVYDRVLDSE